MRCSCEIDCDSVDDMLHCQEVISEDLRATLNAFLYRTGEQSNKYATNKHICLSLFLSLSVCVYVGVCVCLHFIISNSSVYWCCRSS